MSGAKKRKSKLTRFIRRIIVIGLIIAALAAGFMWIKQIILARQVRVINAVDGALATPVKVEVMTANTEQIINTPVPGKLTKVPAEGERVRKNGEVARIVNGLGTTSLYSPTAGLIDYQVDGLEGVLTAENLTDWDLAKFQNLKPTSPAGDSLQSGQAAFKIVDNLKPTYLLFKLPKQGLKQDDRVTFLVNGQKIGGKVLKIAVEGPQAGVVVALNNFLSPSLGKRNLSLEWLDRNPPKGELILPAALVQRNGKTGVYLLQDGVVTWREVNVLAKTTDKVCVDGLNTGDPVITTPAYVQEGEIINE